MSFPYQGNQKNLARHMVVSPTGSDKILDDTSGAFQQESSRVESCRKISLIRVIKAGQDLPMKKFFKKLFAGCDDPYRRPRSAILVQRIHLHNVWNCKKYQDFGLERLLRLLLVLIQFIFPGLYIRWIFGKIGTISRKLAVEFYTLFKLLWALMTLICFSHNLILIGTCIYFSIETLCYILSLIYLSPEYSSPISYKRSILFILINFFEIITTFALLYLNFSELHPSSTLTPLLAFYFSFITATTIGFGDIYPVSDGGRVFVILQAILSLMFLMMFFTYFSSQLPDSKKKPATKKKKSTEKKTESPNRGEHS